MSGRARDLARAALAGLEGPLPRVMLLSGGDPVLASEILDDLLAKAGVADGPQGFNLDVLHAAEIKLRDLASRVEELPLLAAERTIVVKGAEALLKNKSEDLASLWPPAGGSTLLILVAGDEDAKPARKGAATWAEVLPAHAARVRVGAPTEEDALRWGRQACQGSGAAIPDEAWKKAFKRAKGDAARLRTEIEWHVLAALSGREGLSPPAAPGIGVDEAAEAVRAALCSPRGGDIWAAAERYRALGGTMDGRGAEWIRGLAESLLRSEGPAQVDALRALATLQLRWRREAGPARQVLERTGLELTLAAARRGGRSST